MLLPPPPPDAKPIDPDVAAVLKALGDSAAASRVEIREGPLNSELLTSPQFPPGWNLLSLPLDPTPSPSMDDPRFLQQQHRNP